MNFFKIFSATLCAIILSTLLVIAGLVAGIMGVMTATMTSSQSIESESVLVIDLRESITDTPNTNPLSMIDLSTLSIARQTTTLDAIRAIETAASDDRIKGIYIRSRTTEKHSLALLEELRTEIARFKGSGKFVVAYADSYSQSAYYLSTIADSLYLQPEGMVVWQGVAATSTFYKGLLDKLAVDVEVFRPSSCSYKSAVEPLTRRNMSPQSREQSEALVGSIWDGIVAEVAASRHQAPSILNSAATALSSFVASNATKLGMVDRLIYEDELEQVFESLGVKLDKESRAKRVPLGSYASAQKLLLPTLNSKVAVVYAEGVIVDGAGDVDELGGDALARQLRKVRNDKDIKSVVLRVNSPGGSALASDVIWREMSLLRSVKPVVVSMGGYAASGGYYISAPADVIVADKFTITGSIGVYGVLFDIEKSLSTKLGITTDAAKSNASADFMRSSRPITPTERAIMSRSVDQVYDTFTAHVSAGRNLPIERVYEVSQGRVWSGAEALSIGLVDVVGGIKSAILIAAERGGVADSFEIVEYTTTPDELSALFAPLLSKLSATDEYRKIVEGLSPLSSANGVVMFSPLRVE